MCREKSSEKTHPDVGLVLGVSLPLVVEDVRGGQRVPLACVGLRVGLEIEVVAPLADEAVVAGGLEGGDCGKQCDKSHEGGLHEHGCGWY